MKNYILKKPFALWLTGLPCSGKTTTAIEVNRILQKHGIFSVMLDGDDFRRTVSSDLGFSKKDRIENNLRVINFSRLLIQQGIPVLVSFVSPLKSIRNMARKNLPGYIEVFVDTDLETCIKRDVKGHYKMAFNKKIKDMTGINSDFEIPKDSEITLTPDKSLNFNTKKIMKYLKDNAYIFLS